ncbi:hypothetical protein ACFX16_038539 [Malus domestica]
MGMASQTTLPPTDIKEEEPILAKAWQLRGSPNLEFFVQNSNKGPEDSNIASSNLELELREPPSLGLPNSDIYNKQKQTLSPHERSKHKEVLRAWRKAQSVHYVLNQIHEHSNNSTRMKACDLVEKITNLKMVQSNAGTPLNYKSTLSPKITTK